MLLFSQKVNRGDFMIAEGCGAAKWKKKRKDCAGARWNIEFLFAFETFINENCKFVFIYKSSVKIISL